MKGNEHKERLFEKSVNPLTTPDASLCVMTRRVSDTRGAPQCVMKVPNPTKFSCITSAYLQLLLTK